MHEIHRSLCAINLSLEVFGDKWTLLILRDMVFGAKRHFRELLRSEEGISSNILAERLNRLVDAGIITRADDPSHRQKAIYSLTEKGISLLPILVAIGAWGRRYMPVSEELSWRAEYMEKGGPKLLEEFMAELRATHPGTPKTGRSRHAATPIGDFLRSSTPPRLRKRPVDIRSAGPDAAGARAGRTGRAK